MPPQKNPLKLEPLKDASLFYLKTDFAFLAGAAVTFTLFKVDPSEILGLVAFMSPVMYAVMTLILLGVINHAFIVRMQIKDVAVPRSSRQARAIIFLVMVQTAGNVCLFMFSAGFIAKEIDIRVEHASNNSR